MGASANGQALDSYVDAGKRLTQMISAVQTQLKAAVRFPRYRGVLKVWSDPDLVSADDVGLQLQIAGGGTVTLKWSEIPADALMPLVKLVLGAEAEPYRTAIDVLTTVRAGGDK